MPTYPANWHITLFPDAQPGSCVRCGVLYQTDKKKFKTPEFCDVCRPLAETEQLQRRPEVK